MVGEKLSSMLTQKQFRWGIVVILLVTLILRLYKLGEVPHGMTWDEAAIGYNGFAIFTTRRDEWLTRLPISFWSFGDYKAPLAIYLNGFFTFLFGMNLTAVRLPFALSGVLAVWGMILLTQAVFHSAGVRVGQARWLALGSGTLLMLSPWHHHFSRVGFESGIALALLIWGLYFLHRALPKLSAPHARRWLIVAALSLAASMYAYHSTKITVPLLVAVILFVHRQSFKKHWRPLLVACIAGGIALLPLLYDTLFGQSLERAGTLIFFKEYSFFEQVQLFITHFVSHLSAPFLLFGETTTLRHGDGHWGVLFPTTLLLVLIALITVLKNAKKEKIIFYSPLSLGCWLLLLGILPAALGTEVPHANRALLALPGFILLAMCGLNTILSARLLDQTIKRSLLGMLLLIHGLLAITSLNDYYTRFAAESATSFQDGYLEAFDWVESYRAASPDSTPLEKIIFTSIYDQPYIYALFATQMNPIWYQGGALNHYEFKSPITIGDLERPNTLVVASGQDDLLGRNDQADHVVYGSDGSVRFRIYTPQ